MSKQAFYNGILYQIEYQPQLSNKAIASIMEDEPGYKQGEIWSEGWYSIKNKQEPSMLNALHVYYEFSYNEELDVYVYTFVRPYDD
jgi:hypothetical protein